MPRLDYAYCRVCGGHRDQVGPLSRRRKCAACGAARLAENIESMATMNGRTVEPWRRGMILSAGGLLPERLLKGS